MQVNFYDQKDATSMAKALPFFFFALAFGLVLAVNNRAQCDWPTYRHDPHRSGTTSERLDERRLELAWQWRSVAPPEPAWHGPAKWDAYAGIRGLHSMRNYDRVFHAVADERHVYFGSSSDDALHCLELDTGRQVWTYVTGAPVRIAPTIWNGRVLFGSDDGFAYCLDAETGSLQWRYSPSRDERRVLNNGRCVSFWPVRSGVVVQDGLAYFAASMLPWKQSYLCAVEAASGAADVPGGFVQSYEKETFEGPLVVTLEKLITPRGRVAPKLFRRSDGSALGELPGGGGSFVVVTDSERVLYGPGNKQGWIDDAQAESREKIATYQRGRAMIVSGATSYLLTDSQLIASDFIQRKNHWVVEAPSCLALILAGETLFAGGQDEVVAFDTASGRQIWRHRVDGKAQGLAVSGGTLLVSTDEGAVCAFKATGDGQQAESPDNSVVNREENAANQHTGVATGEVKRQTDDADLLGHWLFQRPQMRGKLVRDLAGSQHAVIAGAVETQRVASHEALVLDGNSTRIAIQDDITKARLPVESFTAEAWVRIDLAQAWGSLIGAFQDNGDDEQGWLLGNVNSQFCVAVNGVGGANRLTYLTSPDPFEVGQWYHVAGTYDGHVLRLFVNGKEVARSDEQNGSIQYPDTAFFEIGAYHDKDEDFRMNGQIHEVCLFGRALSEREIRKRAEAKQLIASPPATLAVGPWLRFTNPNEAEVQWETGQPSPTMLRFGTDDEMKVVHDEGLKTNHKVVLTDLPRDRQLRYVIGQLEGGQLVETAAFDCDTFFNYSLPRVHELRDRPPHDSSRAAGHQQTASFLLETAGIDRGICLMFGIGDGQLAYELARASQLRVICIDSDNGAVQQFRRRFQAAGAYGSRVSALHVSAWDQTPLPDQVANLVVLGDMPFGGSSQSVVKEVYRLLRPYGGTALLGPWMLPQEDGEKKSKQGDVPDWTDDQRQVWLKPVETFATKIVHETELWLQLQRPSPVGHGQWTHLYGDASNAAFSGETLEGAKKVEDLEVQWLGRPGPRYQADRNGRKPSPLVANGRLFLQGLHRIVAVDAYNGSVLWALEIPTFERFNMPRDCSNWCVDDQHVYAVMQDRCWKIRAADGQVIKTLKVPQDRRRVWKYDWGYVANVGDLLFGSSVKQGSSFTSFWGNATAGWYDATSGAVTQKVCSDSLFAYDKSTDRRKWTYDGGLIVNPTITLSEGTAYFVECRDESLRDGGQRRLEGPEFWKKQYLVALDLETGKKRWEQPLEVEPGTIVFYLAYGNDKLSLVTSAEKLYHVYVHDADNGKRVWQQEFHWHQDRGDHGRHMSRPAIVGNRLYVRPAVFDLDLGHRLEMTVPDGGCGTYACTSEALVFRDSELTMWDAEGGQTSKWTRLRPDCWLSTIPANGMLLSPEGGGGCSCGSWLETSLGFRPK